MSPAVAPAILVSGMAPFQTVFPRPTWRNLLVLVAATLLAPGRRTVTAALSVRGRRETATFTNFHRVLNRTRGSSRAAARLGLRRASGSRSWSTPWSPLAPG